jgi:hypothetical protein
MKAFHALTDTELDAMFQAELDRKQDIAKLLAAYRDLREHHVAETTALTKRDRSSIMRMAGNIAAGLFADPEFEAETAEELAERAVLVARAIIKIVDTEEPTP